MSGVLGMSFTGAVDERAGEPVVIHDADFDAVSAVFRVGGERAHPPVEVALQAGVEEAEREGREVGAAKMLTFVRG